MLFWFALFFTIFPSTLSAEDYTSASFILRDPVFTDDGGYSTSASFEYISGTGQVHGGRDTSVSFIHCGGFLYFPESATEPCPDATVTPPSPSPSPTPSPPPSSGGGSRVGITLPPYLPPEKTPGICLRKGDLDDDCKVDLVDFSIAAYWYKKPLSERFKAIEEKKLNGDGEVTLRDFSIMAFWWTG